MKASKKIGLSLAILIALLVLIVRLPITTTPGFFIGGTATAVPTNWPDTSSIPEIELRVAGILPKVVIIWFVEIDNNFYIIGETDSGWVSMLGDGGSVHLRLEDSTFSLVATIVNLGEADIIDAWQAKYETDYPEFFNTSASEEFLESSSIYRLSRED